MVFSGNSLLTQIIKLSVNLLVKPNFNLDCNPIHHQVCKVGNATVGQLFPQPIYKVIQSLNFHKALLMCTSLPFISALHCIISVFQLLCITSFMIIFIVCLWERQNFQAKMGPGVTKHNIYKLYSLSNNQTKIFKTCGESWGVWALFPSCFQLPFYHTTLSGHYR